MPFAVVVELNGLSVILSVHPSYKAAFEAADASPFVGAKVVSRKS